jgi:hypothetical protein
MPQYKPMPPLERLNELLEIVEIPECKFGKWSGLIRKVGYGSRQAGSVAGTLQRDSRTQDRVDWRVNVDGARYLASRVIYYMTYCEDPGNLQVDHKDKNSLNNNASNLRLDIDRSIQQVNRSVQRNNTSGVVGVSWYKQTNKWVTHMRIGGKLKNLGYYHCKLKAARVIRNKWIEFGWDDLGRELPDLKTVICDCGACKPIDLG